jgi:DNA-directed RNA polymerase subunit RPC12/RpoP
MSNLITLTCPSCGGRLEITNNTERYVCAHCGNSHIVDPIRQIVQLKAQLKALTTEKDIQRVQEEITDLTKQRQQLRGDLADLQSKDEFYRELVHIIPLGMVAGPAVAALGLAFILFGGSRNSNGDALIVILIGAAVFLLALLAHSTPALRADKAIKKMARGIVALDQAIALKEGELNLLRDRPMPASALSKSRRYASDQQPTTSN